MIAGLYGKLSNKVVFVCGDFNIDLLNLHEHTRTPCTVSIA